jgi:hypothetical protein
MWHIGCSTSVTAQVKKGWTRLSLVRAQYCHNIIVTTRSYQACGDRHNHSTHGGAHCCADKVVAPFLHGITLDSLPSSEPDAASVHTSPSSGQQSSAADDNLVRTQTHFQLCIRLNNVQSSTLAYAQVSLEFDVILVVLMSLEQRCSTFHARPLRCRSATVMKSLVTSAENILNLKLSQLHSAVHRPLRCWLLVMTMRISSWKCKGTPVLQLHICCLSKVWPLCKQP